jgi:hypothetical protein
VRTGFLAALVAFAATAHAGKVSVEDAVHHFSLTVPDDYKQQTPGPKILRQWQRGVPGDAAYVQLQLVALGGTLGREPLNREKLEEAAGLTALAENAVIGDFQYEKIRWRDFYLEMVITHTKKNGVKVVTFGVQVPLSGEAVQLMGVALARDEAQLRSEFASIVESIEGQTNWLTDSERAKRLGPAIGAGVGMIVLLGLLFRFRRRRGRG